MNIHLYTSKGGQGVTTTAVGLAAKLSEEGFSVLLVDQSDNQDLDAALGIGGILGKVPTLVHGDRVFAARTDDFENWATQDGYVLDPSVYQMVIVDWGIKNPIVVDKNDMKILVTAPCYLSLRRYTKERYLSPDLVAFMDQEGRALTAKDVEICTNTPVVKIKWSSLVARSVDAGLLIHRSRREINPLADKIRKSIPYYTTYVGT